MHITHIHFCSKKVEATGMEHKKITRIVLALAILISSSLFFYREFEKNWAGIQTYDIKFNSFFLLLSFAAIAINYLLTTYGWFVTLNSLSGKRKITFPKTIAIVNTSSLMKYIPGKVWSYALQMYWLAKDGFTNTLVLYVSLLNIFIVSITSMILGISFLIISPDAMPLTITIPLLTILLALDISFIEFNSTLFNLLIIMVNKIFKRDIEYFETPRNLLLSLHLIHAVSAFIFGMGAYIICFGIGFDLEKSSTFLVMSSMIISDVIGFLAIIVPGGLGVREGVMYFILKGDASKTLSLILPIATRIVSMLVDITLGTIGIILLKKFTMVKR
jgi:glycosyltransferase 2 family protein